MSGKEFQSIKNLHHSSDTMSVTTRGEWIRFLVTDDDRHDRKLEVGNNGQDDENREYQSCSKTFRTSYITSLCKCAGQSGNIQVFLSEDLPLKIKLKAGNLGEISVYIKSLEMISEEDDDAYVSGQSNEEDEKAHLIEHLSLDDDDIKPRRGRQKRTMTIL
jgi:hypothetical protein